MIQGYASRWWAEIYNVIAPGSRIPEWFADQSMGSSVKVELPSHYLETKLLGMAFCAVVGFKGVIDSSTCPLINFFLTITISLHDEHMVVIGFYRNI